MCRPQTYETHYIYKDFRDKVENLITALSGTSSYPSLHKVMVWHCRVLGQILRQSPHAHDFTAENTRRSSRIKLAEVPSRLNPKKVCGIFFSLTFLFKLPWPGMKSSSQAGLVVEYLAKERTRFDEQRRVVYMLVGCLGVALLFYDLYNLVLGESSLVRTVYIVNDAVFIVCSLTFVFLAYTRRVRLGLLEQAIFVFLALESFVFNSLAPYVFNHSLQEVFRETIADDVWLLLLVCAMALHLFQGWRGVFIAAGLYLASLTVTSGYLVGQLGVNMGTNLASLVWQTYAAGGMVLCFLFVLARYRDHAQRITLQYEMLEQIAFLDALTGLPNRRRMYDVTQQQLELAQRYNTPFCIALLDIDHFKRINDTLGHIKGDEVLVQVAALLRAELRATDQLGRWGGEEFLLVLPQINLPEALAALERSRRTVESHVSVAGQSVTLSCGVTPYLPGDTATSIFQRADEALYEAKRRGRNQVVSSENENSRLSRERLFS
jgi:diguanylate cyclase